MAGLGALCLAAASAVAVMPDPGWSGGGPGALGSSAEAGWSDVLRTLDLARAEAWRRGDPAALGAVYAAGSPLLRADRADLRAYTDRGLRVAGASTTYDLVEVLSSGADRVRLLAVDQLGSTRAVSSVTGRTRALPRDDRARHLITLRQTPDGWRIAAVRPLPDVRR